MFFLTLLIGCTMVVDMSLITRHYAQYAPSILYQDGDGPFDEYHEYIHLDLESYDGLSPRIYGYDSSVVFFPHWIGYS